MGRTLRLGDHVVARGGQTCGQIRAIGLNPETWNAAELLVEPDHRIGLGRIVPIDIVHISDGSVALKVNLDGFNALAFGEVTENFKGPATGYNQFGHHREVDRVRARISLSAELAVIAADTQVVSPDGSAGRAVGVRLDVDGHVSHVLCQVRRFLGHKEFIVPSRAARLERR